jgi:hypothetical protein
MYDSLDNFLKRDTWHSRHPNDQAEFYQALNKVVRDGDFVPERMCEYIREQKGIAVFRNAFFVQEASGSGSQGGADLKAAMARHSSVR